MDVYIVTQIVKTWLFQMQKLLNLNFRLKNSSFDSTIKKFKFRFKRHHTFTKLFLVKQFLFTAMLHVRRLKLNKVWVKRILGSGSDGRGWWWRFSSFLRWWQGGAASVWSGEETDRKETAMRIRFVREMERLINFFIWPNHIPV